LSMQLRRLTKCLMWRWRWQMGAKGKDGSKSYIS
jgi:hypothetical protein